VLGIAHVVCASEPDAQAFTAPGPIERPGCSYRGCWTDQPGKKERGTKSAVASRLRSLPPDDRCGREGLASYGLRRSAVELVEVEVPEAQRGVLLAPS
jgi:hypothetical protein